MPRNSNINPLGLRNRRHGGRYESKRQIMIRLEDSEFARLNTIAALIGERGCNLAADLVVSHLQAFDHRVAAGIPPVEAARVPVVLAPPTTPKSKNKSTKGVR